MIWTSDFTRGLDWASKNNIETEFFGLQIGWLIESRNTDEIAKRMGVIFSYIVKNKVSKYKEKEEANVFSWGSDK